MREAHFQVHESARLDALHKSGMLSSADEGFFANIVRYLRDEFATEIASVAFIDASRQWLKAAIGLSNRITPRSDAFCSVSILSDAPLIVRDAFEDPRFSDFPVVRHSPHIRFYAGAPLIDRSGYRIGAVCVADARPRILRSSQIQKLQCYATMTMRHVELHTLKKAHPVDLTAWLHAQAEAARGAHNRALSGYFIELIYALMDEKTCGYIVDDISDPDHKMIH